MEGFPQQQWRRDAAWAIAVIVAAALFGIAFFDSVRMEFAGVGGEPPSGDLSILLSAGSLLVYVIPVFLVGIGLLFLYALAMLTGVEIFPRIETRETTWTTWHVAKAAAATVLGSSVLISAVAYLGGERMAAGDLQVAGAYIMHIALMGLAMWYVAATGGSWKALGLTLKGWLAGLVHGVVGYVAAVPIFCLSLLVAGMIAALLKLQPQAPEILQPLEQAESPWATGIIVFLIIFFGPLAEEVFFRGFLYPAMRRRLSAAPAIIINGVLFALVHMSVAHLVVYIAIGMVMAWLFEKTRSLVACTTLHVVHNTLQLVLVYHVYGLS
jgi:membrane protease YdiL (CAAX protease family)